HAGQADLALGPLAVLKRKSRQLLLVCTPPEFGRRRPLLAKALDAPGIDELLDLLGPVRYLRVPLAAMDDFYAELMRQPVELQVLDMLGDSLRLRARELLVGERILGDVQQSLLGEVADKSGIGPMFEDRSRPRLVPLGCEPSQVHVPPIERPHRGM